MKNKLKQKLKEADSEMDDAVMGEEREQAIYWRGRKDALKELLREIDNE